MNGGIFVNHLRIIKISHDQVYHLIRENLNHCKTMIPTIVGAKYHHNIPYHKVSNVMKYGILSLKEQYKLEGKILTLEEKVKYSREGGHINGVDEISLASMDIDFSRLYRDEMIYNPYSEHLVDLLISEQIKAYRITEHYANEYLTENKINIQDFKTMDIRLLQYLKKCITQKDLGRGIQNYNELLDIVATMVQKNVDIPIREMSSEEDTFALDKDKILKLPKIILK